jgi:leader peptidase (prepilin peptidase) / N-methyltransferase
MAFPAAAAGWLVICGLPMAVIDIRTRRLPNVLTGAAFTGVILLLAVGAIATGHWPALARAGAGAAAVAAFFALLALIRPGSAGLGDAKLGLSTGALAAWFGWGVLLVSVFAAFALAAVSGLGLIASGRLRLRGGSLPFGPFLLAGCVAAVLLAGHAGPH